MRLDAKTVAGLKLPAGKDDHLEWDDELAGFGVRLRASGRRAWIVQYRPPWSRRTRRVTLGTTEKVTPVEARAAARKLLARVALGHDPQGEREAERARSMRTFRSAAEAHLAAKQGELRPVSYRLRKLYLLGPTAFGHQPQSQHSRCRRRPARGLGLLPLDDGRGLDAGKPGDRHPQTRRFQAARARLEQCRACERVACMWGR